MAKRQTMDTTPQEETKEKTGVSPHLPWEVPKRNPNETAKQKGQLGQNVRQREQAERQQSY